MKFMDVSTKEHVDMEQVLERVRLEAENHNVEVWIGTDSQNCDKKTTFVSVIAIYRKGKGAKIFRTKQRVRQIQSIRQRMVHEAYQSIEVAKLYEETIENLEALDLMDIPMCIHVDVNKSSVHESNKAMKEIMGWLGGMGIAYEFKPMSAAASYAADKYCH